MMYEYIQSESIWTILCADTDITVKTALLRPQFVMAHAFMSSIEITCSSRKHNHP